MGRAPRRSYTSMGDAKGGSGESPEGHFSRYDLRGIECQRTAYIGFDFGTSNSSVSVVSRADVKVYERRARDKSWLELNDLVPVLPYPVAFDSSLHGRN
jgi:molecular chaperone DnaK (HSP70)